MRAGRLDRRITISRNFPVVSESGSVSDGWTDLATVRASVKYNRGSERFTVQQLVGKTFVTFTCRWSNQVSDLAVTDRVTYEGRAFDIHDVRELGNREGMEIDASTRNEEPLTV